MFRTVVEQVGLVIDAAGVLVVVVGIGAAVIRLLTKSSAPLVNNPARPWERHSARS